MAYGPLVCLLGRLLDLLLVFNSENLKESFNSAIPHPLLNSDSYLHGVFHFAVTF